MGWADQPVFVGLIDLDTLAVGQEAGTSDQRDVVEPGDVEIAVVQDPLDPRPMHDWPAQLMGQQLRSHPEPAAQADDLDV